MAIPRGFHSGVVVICPSKSYQSELLKAQADRGKRDIKKGEKPPENFRNFLPLNTQILLAAK